jgi:hypothetical protein
MPRLPFIAAFLATVSAIAQTPTASVVGRVVDPSGAVVPGISVKISNVETNRSSQVTTNAVGDYTVPFLIPGRYVLEATGAGFRTYKHAEFTLQLDQELRIDIVPEVGAPRREALTFRYSTRAQHAGAARGAMSPSMPGLPKCRSTDATPATSLTSPAA